MFETPILIESNGNVTQGNYAGNTGLIAEVHVTAENFKDKAIWAKEVAHLILESINVDKQFDGFVLDVSAYPAFDQSKYPVALIMGVYLKIEPGMSFYIMKPSVKGGLPNIAIASGVAAGPVTKVVLTEETITEKP